MEAAEHVGGSKTPGVTLSGAVRLRGKAARASKVIANSVVAAILLFSMVCVIRERSTVQPSLHGRLDQLLPRPKDLPAWTVVRQPVASSVEMRRVVNEVLQYDDVLYVTYENSDCRIAIYAAYWRPDRVPQRIVSAHTPDVCWPAAGWVCTSWSTAIYVLDSRIGSSIPVEFRTFRKDGVEENVAFFHLMGGRVVDVGRYGGPPWFGFASDLFSYGFRQRDEQALVRVSGNKAPAQLLDTPPARLFIAKLLTVLTANGQRPSVAP